MLGELIGLWVGLNFIGYIAILICIADGYTEFNPSFVNPLVIYKHIKVNWFGTVVLTIVFNFIFVAMAVPYWIYKLLTVGRK